MPITDKMTDQQLNRRKIYPKKQYVPSFKNLGYKKIAAKKNYC